MHFVKIGERVVRQVQSQRASTRDEILYLMKTKGQLSVSDLAIELGITEMAVRRHLNTLERDQYIQATLIRQAMGRPSNMYTLTEKGHDLFPKNYSDIALDFLQDIESLEGSEKIDELFERREERLYQKLRERMQGLTFLEKIKVLESIQNEKGYMVKWEKVGDRIVFREFNCPISDVAKTYNKACECELSLFQRLLGTEQIERPECLAKGGNHCVYVIKQ
jgi:predicted ArsR family transcriptional regulator